MLCLRSVLYVFVFLPLSTISCQRNHFVWTQFKRKKKLVLFGNILRS